MLNIIATIIDVVRLAIIVLLVVSLYKNNWNFKNLNNDQFTLLVALTVLTVLRGRWTSIIFVPVTLLAWYERKHSKV